MALAEIDRRLLERCLAHSPRSWEDFVDRFLGLVMHVINHTGSSRSTRLTAQDREDLAAEVFLAILANDFAVLRNFRAQSSLATYLTVIARRVVVRELLRQRAHTPLLDPHSMPARGSDSERSVEDRIVDHEEVARLLEGLSTDEAEIVRLYHLEGRSYQEISSRVGIPENSIGPTLSRARAKMRRAGADTVV